jgi:predicted nucleotidyltransferase component of viral defense system
MIVKGGVLLAIQFHSTRFTKDIDFSTSELYNDFDKEKFISELSENLTIAVETLPYDLDCRIQSEKIDPKGGGTYPTLRLKVGYAVKGSNKHKKLLNGNCPDTLAIDYSFNEKNTDIEYLEINDDMSIKAYCLADLVGEKYRALLQQVVRNRVRRQDAYDIYWLLENNYLNSIDKADILKSLRIKSTTRELIVTSDSILDPEIKSRSKQRYETLAQEIEGVLPDFEVVYRKITDYYLSLPW